MQQDVIKKKVRERYGKIALQGSSDCCSPDCCSGDSPIQSATVVGYNAKDLESIPQTSIIGAGCGAPLSLQTFKIEKQ